MSKLAGKKIFSTKRRSAYKRSGFKSHKNFTGKEYKIKESEFSFDINSSSGLIFAGIATVGTLNVGTGGTIITTSDAVGVASVGIGSTLPTATLDINGHTKFKTYSEVVASPSISGCLPIYGIYDSLVFLKLLT